MGGHCVAVVQQDGTWIRPVSATEDGELSIAQCMLRDTSRALQPLDVVRAEFGKSLPKPYQPEDRAFPPAWTRWQPGLSKADIDDWLASTVDHGADFLERGYADRIPTKQISKSSPMNASLALVIPTDLVWQVNWGSARGKKQVRARFTLKGVTATNRRPVPFNLVVTDPVWCDRVLAVAGRELRDVRHEELDPTRKQTYLTLSLGEVYKGNHYKLVAAVIA
jgi:hypothetical protein